MAKHLNVSLGFTADTSQAKAQLQDLQKTLNNLTKNTATSTPEFKFTKDIQEATEAAAQLSVQLKNATNVNTGNLDLTKFSESMKASGMSLEKYQNQLYQLGPAGEKAFADLTRSITLAEVPMRRSSKLLNEMWTTMKNTARWQLTSSAMHGFMGAVSTAYNYVQDLNSSLNNIRIVTGYSVDKMAEFATEANKAAKALSTTTVEYTDASLIYYQQGLSTQEVKDRTEITIKMANAAGESAAKVSDQLTAVWNNFYDGTKSLEHYADVMTALGAKTASSTDEIAGGLEKFASVADTIGLSYEYAASALATITSNTRDSEEVVGTALKTIFARIQGLNLGQTLDDGTTLNKYSEALQKVGISIFDAAGGLKNMDTILDEMGNKWDTLNRSQQVALAQTVAGVRQYTQLTALMNNWDNGDGDSMQANLQTANNATGALQEQADIYAESWEAANKRVQASAESVYAAILNDEFFIDLTNGFADIIDGVKTFIDGMGGIKGVLLAIGGIITNVFSKQISESIQNAIYNMKMFTKKGQEAQLAFKKQANEQLIQGYKDSGTTSGGQSAEAYSALARNQLAYLDNVEKMSQEEQQINQILMDRNRTLADEAIAAGKVLEKVEDRIKKERSSLQVSAQLQAQQKGVKNIDKTIKDLDSQQKKYEQLTKTVATFNNLSNTANSHRWLKTGSAEAVKLAQELKDVVAETSKINTSGKNMDSFDSAVKKLQKSLGLTKQDATALWQALSNPKTADLKDLTNKFMGISITSEKAAAAVRNSLIASLKQCGFTADEAEQQMVEYDAAIDKFGPSSEQAADALRKLNNVVDEHNKKMEEATKKPIPMTEAITKASSAMMSFGQVVNQVKGIIDVFNDSEATTGDKILALVSGIGMLIPAIMAIAPAFSTAKVGATLFGAAATKAGIAANMAMWQVTLIVAGITAIIAAIAFLVTQESAAEKKAKKTAEAAEGLAEAANEAKQALEDIKSAFDGYDTAVTKLNECTKGTQEWRDALQAVNQEVLDIIANNPELASMMKISRDANGMMVIDNKDEILQAAQDRANYANYASMMGNVTAKQAQDAKSAQDLIWSREAQGVLTDTVYTSEGSYQIKNATGKFVEEYASEIAQAANADDFKTQFGYLQEASGMTAEAFNQMVDTLYAAGNEDVLAGIRELGNASTATAQQLENSANAIADMHLGDEYDIGSKEIGSEAYEATYQKHYEDALKLGTENINRSEGKNNADVIKFWEEYSKATGTNYALSDNAVQGNDQNRYFEYLENGEKKLVSLEEAAAAIAATKALEDLGVAANTAKEVLNSIEPPEDAGYTKEDVSNFLANGNFDTLTQDAFEAVSADLAQDDTGKFVKHSGNRVDGSYQSSNQAIYDFYGGQDNFEKIAAAQLGVSDMSVFDEDSENYNEELDEQFSEIKSQMRAEFLEAANNAATAFDSLGEDMAAPIQEWYSQNNEALKGFTAAGQQEILNSLSKAFELAGTDGMESLGEVFAAAGEDADDLQSLLAGVDWGDPNAVQQLNTAIEEQGLDIDTTSEAWIAYTTAMSEAGLAIGGIHSQFANLRGEIASVQSITDGLESGSIISDEDYQTLLAMNPAIKELFGVAAEGYQFLGEKGTLDDLLLGNVKQSLEDVKNEFESLSTIGESLLTSNWFDENGEQIATTSLDKVSMVEDTVSDMDAALKYLGISEESLTAAKDYVKEWTDATTGEMKEGANAELYENSLAQVEEYYAGLQNIRMQYESGSFNDTQAEELWASSLCQGIKELTNAYDEGSISVETYKKYFDQLSQMDLTNIRDAINVLAEGGELSSEQEAYLEGLTEQWPELADAALAGSEAYADALREVEREIANMRIDDLLDKQEEIEIDIDGNPEELQETLDEFMENDYQINVEIKAQLDRELDDALSKLHQIRDTASMIGDDFLVAADDIASVAAVFPGILENATTTADGMIQLDSNVAQAAIAAAQTEVNATAESVAAKLRTEAGFYRKKSETYAAMAQAAGVLASAETASAEDTANAKATIEDGLTTLKEIEEQQRLELSNEETQGEVNNAEQVDTAVNTAMSNASANAQSGYSAMAIASQQSAEAQIQNARAIDTALAQAVDGIPGNVTGGGTTAGTVGNSYEGVTGGYTFEAQTVTGGTGGDTLDVDVDDPSTDWEALAEQWGALAESTAATADNLEAGALAIEATQIETENLVDNVNSGLGADGEDDDAKGGGSGGKDDDELETKELSEKADQYADIDAQIEAINAKLEEQKKITENSEGEEKLASLKEEAKLLEQLNGKYEEKLALAQDILATSKAELQALNSNLQFDDDGNILNQVSVLNDLTDKINDAKIKFNNAASAAEQEVLEEEIAALEKQYEILAKAIKEYEETLALIREIKAELSSNNYEIQDKYTVDEGGSADGDAQQTLEDIQKENYEKLTKQLEINLSFDDNQLKLIEHYLEAIADDFYQMGEAAALTSSKVGNLTGKLSSYEDFYNSLQGANISQEDLIAGMQESADGILDTLNELIALDKEMMEFYGNTLDAAAEELGYFTEQLSHHTELLDHYRNIVEMINGEMDYDTIGTILEGSVTTTKNEMDVAVANYEMLLSEKAALEASLAMAPDEAARELYEKELRAITEACNEAEAEMLDKTEAWAEAMKAVLENTMAKAAHEMELALTDGMSFDYWASSMDRLSSYSDEVLTKTNQLYETQKMINTAQQAIDKTTNNAAKARLKSYQDEIKSLQDKNTLSQTELDLAQARYEVLLAEIALEEAQNAKATVRLQRDNEGNFGYVYTADQDAISGAEQELADAQNALYNVGLEGANEYGQKMIELKQETAEALIELEEMRASGEIATTEEYEARKQEILENAYARYELYSEIYTEALGADTALQQEAWITAYSNMMGSTEEWKVAVVDYTNQCEQAYSEWRTTVQSESTVIDSVLNHTESEVKDVTKASNDLKNKVVGEVIPAIQNELQQVRAATSAYASQRSMIQSLISHYQQLAASIMQAVAAQNALAGASGGNGSGGGGTPSNSKDYDPNFDYSAAMWKLAQNGGYGSEEYQELERQRQEKLDDIGSGKNWLDNEQLDDLIGSGAGPGEDGWFTDEDLIGLASGGYTGKWGPEGRLALLHEKELMLNPDDTVNFLTGIDILRDIVKTIDLESLRNRQPIYSTLPIYDTQPIKDVVEQQVSIAATFPAVTDRHEIEEAFNNLINTATQYANRKLL